MSDFTIEQLEALKEGTTPGPWEATKDDILRAGWRDRLLEKRPWYAEDEWDDEISYMAPNSEFVLSNPEPDYKPLTNNRADMELVASAPALLDALIAEKRAYQELRAKNNDAATRVVRAVTNAGTHPAHHQRQLDRLRSEWPTLYYALMALVGEAGPCPITTKE